MRFNEILVIYGTPVFLVLIGLLGVWYSRVSTRRIRERDRQHPTVSASEWQELLLAAQAVLQRAPDYGVDLSDARYRADWGAAVGRLRGAVIAVEKNSKGRSGED